VADRALRVLFDAHQLGRRQTGNETYVRGLLEAYRPRGDIELTALVEEPALADPAARSPFRRRRVPRSGTLRLLTMAAAARSERPDLVHAIYFAPFAAGRPVVLTVHDISYEIHPGFFGRKERLRGRTLVRSGARRAAAVVTVSETSRRDIIERYGLPDERVVAIHNGVSERFLTAPAAVIEPIGDRPIRILAVGTLQPRKNLLRLLDAVRQVAASRPAHLRVVGPDGHQARVIRDALGDAVEAEIVGYVPDERLPDEYAAADMLVYPSIYEGFGLPVVEAMAVGLPVVTSTGGSLPEIAGDAALLVDPLDVDGIARAILRLADDTGLRERSAAAGRERARRFTWSASADAHLAVYRAVAGV
jgi:glycosyltransferase involved in cell wall biosynthesis